MFHFIVGLILIVAIYSLNKKDIDHVIKSIVEIIKKGRRNSD